MIYGLSLILYALTENQIFFISNRWILAFGGVALLWLGIDAYKKNFEDIPSVICQILLENNGKMFLLDIMRELKYRGKLPVRMKILETVIEKMNASGTIKLTEESKVISVELLDDFNFKNVCRGE